MTDQEQKDLSSARSRLTELKAQRETLSKTREKFANEIASCITKLKDARGLRDKLTEEVKTLKEDRGKLNRQVSSAIGNIKGVPRRRPQNSSKKLLAQIELLNSRIEMEVMKFDAEKKIMSLLKQLKKEYENTKKTEANVVLNEELSGDVKETKTHADDVHKKIQDKAKLSQVKHEEMLEIGKKVDDLRESMKPIDEELKTVRSEIREISKEVGETFEDNRKKRDNRRAENESKRRKKQEQDLAVKQKAVKEKMASGGKLTTEDLLILQTLPEDEF
jgi:uncharacterized coiled-coil DUF342 family protein